MGNHPTSEATDHSRTPLDENELQQVHGGLIRGDLSWIRELACRQGVPFDVLRNGRFESILDRAVVRR